MDASQAVVGVGNFISGALRRECGRIVELVGASKRAYRKRERNKHEAHSAIKQIIPVDQRNLNLGFLLPPGSMCLASD